MLHSHPFLSVALNDAADGVVILDQTLLPHTEVYVELRTPEAIREAICALKVRGAPAIGVCAAYGVYVCSRAWSGLSRDLFASRLFELTAYLESSRPTAVNLATALRRMEQVVTLHASASTRQLITLLGVEAAAFYQEDVEACRMVGTHGLSLLRRGMGLLTHCNAGALATSQYGTALAPIYLGHEQGYGFKVFVDETRPLLQGARLTAYELNRAGVDATLICDNMAAAVMRKGWVDAVLVGCDRIAANGDTANKVGTLGLAILARHFNIPFYVLGPTTTIDCRCGSGDDIAIEERSGEEITSLWYSRPMAPVGVERYNPAFDVTPHSLITAIVTERGVIPPPFDLSSAL